MAGIKFVDNTEKEQIIKGTPKVPINKSKKLSSMDGSQVLYYIDVETAFKMKLETFCDFTQKHPQTDSYVLITVPIERVE